MKSWPAFKGLQKFVLFLPPRPSLLFPRHRYKLGPVKKGYFFYNLFSSHITSLALLCSNWILPFCVSSCFVSHCSRTFPFVNALTHIQIEMVLVGASLYQYQCVYLCVYVCVLEWKSLYSIYFVAASLTFDVNRGKAPN